MILSGQAEAVVLVVVAAAVEDSAVQVEVVADSAVVEAAVAQTEGESSVLFSCQCLLANMVCKKLQVHVHV